MYCSARSYFQVSDRATLRKSHRNDPSIPSFSLLPELEYPPTPQPPFSGFVVVVYRIVITLNFANINGIRPTVSEFTRLIHEIAWVLSTYRNILSKAGACHVWEFPTGNQVERLLKHPFNSKVTPHSATVQFGFSSFLIMYFLFVCVFYSFLFVVRVYLPHLMPETWSITLSCFKPLSSLSSHNSSKVWSSRVSKVNHDSLKKLHRIFAWPFSLTIWSFHLRDQLSS